MGTNGTLGRLCEVEVTGLAEQDVITRLPAAAYSSGRLLPTALHSSDPLHNTAHPVWPTMHFVLDFLD